MENEKQLLKTWWLKTFVQSGTVIFLKAWLIREGLYFTQHGNFRMSPSMVSIHRKEIPGIEKHATLRKSLQTA